MNRTPVFITIILIAVAALAAFYVTYPTSLSLTDAELVRTYIAIATCLGASTSATFVVFSYWQTNRAFIEAQRPHLLVQVETIKAKDDATGELVPMTRIHYGNITTNRFTDLTMIVNTIYADRTFNLSSLFRKKMTMIGKDVRQRTFNTFSELRSLGLELQEVASAGNEIRLTIDYEYTFNGRRDYVNAQIYRWDAKRQEWSIC